VLQQHKLDLDAGALADTSMVSPVAIRATDTR
jgi:hypothetical protein